LSIICWGRVVPGIHGRDGWMGKVILQANLCPLVAPISLEFGIARQPQTALFGAKTNHFSAQSALIKSSRKNDVGGARSTGLLSGKRAPASDQPGTPDRDRNWMAEWRAPSHGG
jgi:hypothetical protein